MFFSRERTYFMVLSILTMIFASCLFILFVSRLVAVVVSASEDLPAIPSFDEDFVKHSFFVDKTELLGEFFKNHQGADYNYASYPSKFGKTINLQMIKRFCQIQLNSEKIALNWTRSSAYELFKNLKISRNRDIFSNHLARHPVIWLDLNFTLKGVITEVQLIAGLNEQMRKCYLEYHWLIELAKNSNAYFYNETMDKALEGKLTSHELIFGLSHLARLLNDYFKTGVVLLIDNYDLVLNFLYIIESKHRMFLKPITRAMLKETLTHRENFVSHALIVGLSLWNYNLKDYDNSTAPDRRLISVKTHPFLSDTRFSAYFGFTEPEMRTLCDQYECTDDEKWLLKQLYDGYTNPNMFQSGLKSVYNPYSVTQFAAHRKTQVPFRNYWIRTQDTIFIYLFLRELHFRKQLVELLKYESIVIGAPRGSLPSSYCTFDHLRTWYEPYNSSLLEYFFDCGYLTYDHNDFNRVRIPNDDIRQFLSAVLIQHYKENEYQIEKLRKVLDEILVKPINESTQQVHEFQLLLISTLHLMNTKFGRETNSTSNSTTTSIGNYPRRWIFKPEAIRVEVHNILMALTLELYLNGRGMLVARISRKYPDLDHILLYDRNETLVLRINHQIRATSELPDALRDALLPEMGKMRVKILEVGISDKIEVNVELRSYKDNRSTPLADQGSTTNIKLHTLFPA